MSSDLLGLLQAAATATDHPKLDVPSRLSITHSHVRDSDKTEAYQSATGLLSKEPNDQDSMLCDKITPVESPLQSSLPSNIISVSDQGRLKTNPPTEVNLGLPQDIAYLFPANYSYLVVEHSKKEQDAFLGAESHNFTLTVWTNVNTPQAAVQ